MKKLHLLKTILLLCALIAGSNCVWATSYTYKLTIIPTDFTTSSYSDNNGVHYKDAICTTDGSKTFPVSWTSDQVYQKSSNIQFQKGNGYIYNNTDLGTISNITITSTAGAYKTYYGTTSHPTSGEVVGNGFFTIKENNNATGVVSSIEITFTAEEVTQVATPDFSIQSGTYFDTKNVTLSCATGGATIHYTIDGTTPTSGSPTYSSSISVSSTTTIKAIAVKDGLTDSEIASATYTILYVSPSAKGINSNYFRKVTNISELEDGDAILIVNEGKKCAMSTTESSNVRLATDVTISNNAIREPSESVQKITIVKVNDYYFFYTGLENGYLYAAGGTNNNYLKTTTTLNTDAIASLSITSGDVTIAFQGLATRNLLRYNYNGGSNPRFTCYASGQQAVQIYKEVPSEPSDPVVSGSTVTLTTTANMAGWRTYNNNTSKKYSVDGNTKVYYASATGDNKVTLTEIDGGVPANTAVILHNSASTTITLTQTDASITAPGSNLLQVSTEGQNLGKVYRLGYKASDGVGFYTYTTASAPSGIIYVSSVSSANFLSFDFDETTGIENLTPALSQGEGAWFDLQGRKVAQPTKGLYIVNGRKVVIK